MSIESKVYLDLARIWNLGPEKERLEEATMHEDCEDCIKRNICTRDVPKPCKYRYTEEERIADQASDRFGDILHKIYLHPTFRKKKEENTMKATSTEEFKDIIAIDFELQTFPNPDVEDKFIVSATNRDDIFCFVFEGPNLRDACRNVGLFTGWEKDQKIRELEEELGRWKKEAEDCLKLMDEAQKEAYKLKKENEKLKELKTPTIWNFADEEPSSRSDILDLAKKCVCGQREQDYGTPESNFKLIADLWNDYLGLAENGDGVPIFSIKNITPIDVSMMMALMKIARIRNGGGSGDSFVDLAGYAACGGEIWALKKETNGDLN